MNPATATAQEVASRMQVPMRAADTAAAASHHAHCVYAVEGSMLVLPISDPVPVLRDGSKARCLYMAVPK
jgi:hypothetical protein